MNYFKNFQIVTFNVFFFNFQNVKFGKLINFQIVEFGKLITFKLKNFEYLIIF